jgi:amino acid adenylation domain-containing protein
MSESAILVFDRELIEERNYWIERLGKRREYSGVRPDRETGERGVREREEFRIAAELKERIEKVAGGKDFLIYTTMMAGLKVCLSKYSGSRTVVVGSPVLREEGGEANVVVMVDEIREEERFREVMEEVRETLLEGYRRQTYPYGQLKRDIGEEVGMFEVGMGMREIHEEMPEEIEAETEMMIVVRRDEEGIEVEVRYDGSKYERERIKRFIKHYQEAVRKGLEDPGRRVREIEMVEEEERIEVVEKYGRGKEEEVNGKVEEMIASRARKRPDAIAVQKGAEEITYRELNRRGNQMGRYLRRKGVGVEEAVGISMERGVDMVVAIVGVLKAGGAYVPLDRRNPEERIKEMARKAGIRFVIVDGEEEEAVLEEVAEVIRMREERDEIEKENDEDIKGRSEERNLGYIMYTSGTTGEPKGVMIERRGIRNLAEAEAEALGLGEESRVLQYAVMSFDASVWEIFGTLEAGGRLILGEWEEMLPGEGLKRLVREQGVSVVTMPPTVLMAMAEEGLEGVKTVVAAGEKCRREIVERWGRGRKVINAYGPTECTVCATTWEMDEGSERVWIGEPIKNVRVYVMDESMGVVGKGVEGEICIGGMGVGRGYRGRVEETAHRYVPDPYSREGGERIYRTGDKGRWGERGKLEMLGRDDGQVKVRGYRIELGEIEAKLEEEESIRQAVVVVKGEEELERRIVAYVVEEEGREVEITEVRRRLRERLPEYMAPNAYVVMKEMPLSKSGKVDRRRLQEMEEAGRKQVGMYERARSPIEEILVGIWREVLEIDRVGIHDNFFDLGGHSLLATRVNSWIRDAFQVELYVGTLFDQPTIARLARTIEDTIRFENGLEPPPFEIIERGQPVLLSFSQLRLWLLNQLEPYSAIHNLPLGLRLTGNLNLDALKRSLIEIINRHEVLRTTFSVVDGSPVQVIHPSASLNLEFFDLSAFGEEEQEVEVARHRDEHAREPFNLRTGPLFRAHVLKLGSQDHIALLSMHHIIGDRWSMDILIKEMGALYQACVMNSESPLPRLPIQYADFAAWQRQWLRGEILNRQLDYWRKQLSEEPALINLPADHPRQPEQSYQGGAERWQVSLESSQALKRLSQREGATLSMTLLAAFNVLLYRYTWEERIVIGTPIANRDHAETEGLIGFLVNTLPISTDLSGDPTFRELLKRVRESVLGACAHQDLPVEKLIEELQLDRAVDAGPLFPVLFLFQNAPMSALDLDGLTISPIETDGGCAMSDLSLIVAETAQGLNGTLIYNSELFDSSTINEMLDHFRIVLDHVSEDPEIRLVDVPIQRDAHRIPDGTVASQNALGREQFDF